MFRPLTLNDKTWMDRCRSSSLNDMTVLSFPAVYTWQSTFGLTVDREDNFYVIRSEADRGYYYPVGEREACRAYVRSLMEDPRTDPRSGTASAAGSASPALSSAPGSLKLLYVPEQELEWLEEQGFEISCEQNTSEYVYSSRSLALLDHGSGTNYRVKVKHFSRDNEWQSRTLSFPEDEALLREKTAEWDLASGGGSVDFDVQQLCSMAPWDTGSAYLHNSDRLAALTAAKDPAPIGLSGVYIETSTGDWAFLLGYPSTSEIYDMSIVKYSPDISRNAVPACICEMAKRVCSAFPYINLEDDLGNPGLRRMKQLYHPLFLLDSYTAVWHPDSV